MKKVKTIVRFITDLPENIFKVLFYIVFGPPVLIITGLQELYDWSHTDKDGVPL